MDVLRSAIASRRWADALPAALAWWRDHRTVAVGQLVSAIARQLGEAQPHDHDDDPRVAMQLASRVVDDPTDPRAGTWVGRIRQLGYALAVTKAASVWNQLATPLRNMLQGTVTATPDASDDEARVLLDAIAGPEIAALWAAVIERPDELERRLVLGDALLERGDPRGELFALQRHAAGWETASHLVELSWHELLGETALAVQRQSRFVRGLLSSISVGTVMTPPWVYERPLDARELCALRDVSPGYVHADHYARFLAGLPRMPAWVRLETSHLGALRAIGAALPFEGVELSLFPYPRDLAAALVAITSYAPTVRSVAVRLSSPGQVASCLEAARVVRSRVPHLEHFYVGVLSGSDDEAMVDAVRDTPEIELVDVPLEAWSCAWT